MVLSEDEQVKKKNLQIWGKNYLLRGHIDQAFKCLDLALKIDSKSPETLSLLGELALHTQSYSEAVLFFQKAIFFDPKNIDLLKLYEISLEKCGKEEML